MLMTPTTTTATTTAIVTTACNAAPTSKEITRRMLEVRASWNVQERIRRRHEARERFEELLSSLAACSNR